jgi:hypothetical protein
VFRVIRLEKLMTRNAELLIDRDRETIALTGDLIRENLGAGYLIGG